MPNVETIEIIGPALIAGLVLAIVHGTLGIKVLERGIIFIDLAIAQIAALGLVIANLFLHVNYLWLPQLIAFTSAAVASLFFYYVEKKIPKQQEAIIGCSFVVAASVVILLLANNPHGGDEIQHLLAGQMLFITWLDLVQHLPIYIGVISLWFLRPQCQKGLGFYFIFAAAVTASVQLVGVYLVFASLILPALAAVDQEKRLLVAWMCGMLAVFSGLVLALIFDLPAGSLVVIAYVAVTCCIRFVQWVWLQYVLL